MSKVTRCDVCGKVFDYGFSADVNIQGGQDFTNIAEDRFEIGKKDICKACYYKIRKLITQFRETTVKKDGG